MEAVYYAARANLRRLMREHPTWKQAQYATTVGMSVGWVKKWLKRLRQGPPNDEAVLHGQSRARKHPPERIREEVVDRILEIRDQPPEGLGRTPGPKAILYYLPRDESLQQAGLRLPRSSRTVYRILCQADRIHRRLPRVQEPLERPAPMSRWQMDAHSMSAPCRPSPTASSSTSSKCSTPSMWAPRCWWLLRRGATSARRPAWRRWRTSCAPMDGRRRSPSTATRALSAARKAATFLPRWCASRSRLGVAVVLCDPHHPAQNGFVERYNRTYQQECLWVHRPSTLSQVREMTDAFVEHYNWQRPHQGIACGNRPPRTAFPTLPELPGVPDVVNPDRWLEVSDGLHVVRTVRRNGTVSVESLGLLCL